MKKLLEMTVMYRQMIKYLFTYLGDKELQVSYSVSDWNTEIRNGLNLKKRSTEWP